MSTKDTICCRITVQFNTRDEAQSQCLKFLNICGYKKNQILALMAKEFIETYGFDIEELTQDNIKEFLEAYQYIQDFKNKPAPMVNMAEIPTPIIMPEQNSQSQIAVPVVNKNVVNDKDDNKMIPKIAIPTVEEDDIPFEVDEGKADQALSAFGL